MNEDPYRRIAGLFDTIFEPMNRGLGLIGLSMFRPGEGMAILDVGCGTGVHLELYWKYGCSLFEIDSSPSIDFHPGPYHFFKGCLTKLVIFISELAAGGMWNLIWCTIGERFSGWELEGVLVN